MKIEVWNKKKLMLHTELAKGEYDGDKFRVIQSIPPAAIVMEFPEAQYVVTLEELTREVIAFRDNVISNLLKKHVESTVSEVERVCAGAEAEE